MIAMSTAASRPTSTEAVRKRPARAAFTSSLIACSALAVALLAPAGVANAQPAVRTAAHSTSLAAGTGQGGDSGTCLDAGQGNTACLFKKQPTQASAAGSGDGAETTGGGTGSSGTNFFDWILQMVGKIAPVVGQVAGAATSIGNAVSAWAPSTAAGQAVGQALHAVTGKS